MIVIRGRFVVLTVCLLSACGNENIQRSTYEVLQQRSCIEQEGQAQCEETSQPDYDAYQRERR